VKKARAWITCDGVVHLDRELALSHAERRYGDALSKLAHELCRVEKYGLMTDWLDRIADRFRELDQLRRDREVEDEDVDE